jgi:hypothetical protein
MRLAGLNTIVIKGSSAPIKKLAAEAPAVVVDVVDVADLRAVAGS